jgi:hypothetical protein
MIGGPQIFHILTEFKFEIGSALLGTKTLTGAVGELSQAADNTLFSFQKMGLGVVAQMGLGTGGVLGILHSAIEASEKFGATQRKIANIFLSNPDNIQGGAVSFMEAMQASDSIMTSIVHKARQFAIPASALTETVGAIAPVLFREGAAGKNLETAIDMSRGLLKSAPTLGVDPGLVQGQLVDLIMGRGSAGDRLSMRLASETQAFQEVLGKGGAGGAGKSPLAAFNALPIEKRVDVLNRALLQFGSNSEILKANAYSLTQQLQVLSDTMKGMFSILRPIGSALADFIAPALARFNEMLQTQGSNISKQLGQMLRKVLGSPEELVENLFQVKSLRRDMDSASKVLSVAGITMGIGNGLKFFGVITKAFSPWIAVLTGSLQVFYDVWERTPSIATKVTMFTLGIGALIAALVAFPPLAGIVAVSAALTGFFQLLSRAEGIAKVTDAKKLPQLMEDLTRVTNAFMTTMGRALKPFTAVFDALAHFISPIFEVAGWIELLTDVVFKFTYALSFLEGSFSGIMEAIQTFMEYFTSTQMIGNPTGIFDAVAKSFTDEFDRIMNENLSSLTDSQNGAVMNQITNIGKVEIRNEFKEQLEPDRIAFTLKDQLMKTAQNPTQAARRSFSGALAGAGG